MNRPVLTTVFVTIALATALGHACEQFALPPIASPPGFTDIIGVVEGHVVRQIELDGVGVAPGVVVEVRESSGPFPIRARLEVFPLAADIGCDPIAPDAIDIEEQYPVGAKVSLAWRLDGEASPTLILKSGGFGSLARVPDSVPRVGNGCLDFKSFRDAYEPNGHPYSFEIGWRNAQRGRFEDHELLRCYVLVDTADDTEERLAAYWSFD